MNTPLVRKTTWNKQAAIVISDSPNMHMLLRELIRSYGWTVLETTPSTEHAISQVRLGLASLIIIDDTIASPAVYAARHMIADPITLCTPTLTFMMTAHESEGPALLRLGCAVVEKPLTPSKFMPSFIGLVRRWEKEPLLTLRRVTYMYQNGHEAQATMTMAKLMSEPTVQHICAQSIALALRQSGKIKEAEQILLGSLKRSARELTTILALADLYLHAGMPKMAHRLLLSARTAYNSSMITIPDLVQAALMLGQVDDAIKSLNIILKTGVVDALTLNFMGRLLFAEGREAEAERLLTSNGAPYRKFLSAWLAADAVPVNAAAG